MIKIFTIKPFELFKVLGVGVLTLFLLVFPSKNAEATHVMGSDITWRCLGNGKYEITLAFYRQCNGVSFSNNKTISFYCSRGGSQLITTANLPNVSVRDVTPNCSNVQGACDPPNTQTGKDGVEEHLYTTVVDFNSGPLKEARDAGCCRILMTFGECCRNSDITTGAGDQNYMTDAEIDFCNVENSVIPDCDNSPELRNPPIGYLCCNQPFYFNNGAVDIDGDSLFFSMAVSQSALGVSVPYNSPYNPITWPMTGYCKGAKKTCNCVPGNKNRPTEGWCFDPLTGDISFHPIDCEEVGIMVVKIEQFRLDKDANEWLYIGYTKRDLQLKVVNCGDNNPPELGNLKSPTVCEGEKICFKLKATDEEYMGGNGAQTWKDTIDLSWNRGLPGATFEVGDPGFEFQGGVVTAVREVEICWQTKEGDGREAPYLFTVTAKDKACPRNAVVSRGYSVKVKRRAYADRILTEGVCGKWTLESVPHDSFWFKGAYQHSWEIRDSTNMGIPVFRSQRGKDSLQFIEGGKYIISYRINNPPVNCPSEYSDTIEVPELLRAIVPTDTFACERDSVQVPLEVKYGKPPYKIQWDNPLKTQNPKDTFDYLVVKTDKDKYVSANVTDKNGCTSSDTTFVLAVKNPVPDIGPDRRICSYDTLFLSSNYRDDGDYKFHWSRSQLNGDSLHDIWLNKPGIVYHKVIDTLGCWGIDSMELFVNEKVVADAGSDLNICIRSKYPINNDTLEIVGDRSPTQFPGTFLWSHLSSTGGGKSVVSTDSTFEMSYSDPDSIFYELFVTVTEEDVTCVDADTVNIKILPLPVIQFSPMDPKCFDYGRVNLKSGDGPKARPSWLQFSHKKEGIVNQNFFETDSFPEGTKPYEWVRADGQDPFGCYNIDSFQVVINPNPKVELDSGVFCQNADFGSMLTPKITAPALIPLMRQTGVVSVLSIDAVPTWKVISAPSFIPESSYKNLIVNFGSSGVNKALNVGPVNDKTKLGWYGIELCAMNTLTGCTSCDTTYLEVVELPEIEFTVIPNQCVNFDTLDLNKHVNLKNGRWFTKSGTSTSGTPISNHSQWVADSSKFLPFKGPGLFELKYVHTASGCYVADSTEVNVSALPVVRLDTFSLVCNTSGNRPLKSLNPANPESNGKWSGFGVKKNGNDYYLDPSESPSEKQYEGPYEISFHYTHPFTGCTNADTFDIRIQSQPELEITSPKPFEQCEFIPFELSSTMKFANTVTWTHDGDGSFNNAKSLTPIYTHGTEDTSSGNVNVYVETDAFGVCPQVKDSALLLIRPYPQFDFEGTPLQGCQPLTVDFTSLLKKPTDGDVSYFWELDSSNTSSVEQNPTGIVYKDAGDYTIKLVVTNNKAGCETSEVKVDYVNVYPNPVASFKTSPASYTTVAMPRFKTTNLSGIQFGTMEYLWDFGTGNPDDTSTKMSPEIFYDQDTGNYLISLQVTSDKGCVDSAEQWVQIGPDVTVFIPNAFSPNGFGPELNNRFYVFAQGIIAFHIDIFNRWGERLYESDLLEEGWDGKFKGIDCQQDVYTYVVRVTGFDKEVYDYKGTFTLIR